jgi:hypothetical protein
MRLWREGTLLLLVPHLRSNLGLLRWQNMVTNAINNFFLKDYKVNWSTPGGGGKRK